MADYNPYRAGDVAKERSEREKPQMRSSQDDIGWRYMNHAGGAVGGYAPPVSRTRPPKAARLEERVERKEPEDESQELRKFVITGGPGCGKTTLIKQLVREGYETVPEAARSLIERYPYYEQLRTSNPTQFQDAVFSEQLGLESLVEEGIAFLDRGVLDTIAYSAWLGVDPPQRVIDSAAFMDYEAVFVLEPLPESLYVQDKIRTETYAQAKEIHTAIIAAYEEHGFEVVRLPAPKVNEPLEKSLKRRIAFIEDHIAQTNAREIEGKYEVSSHDPLISRLEELGAQHLSQDTERNAVYRLLGEQEIGIVRLREYGSGKRELTFKSPSSSDVLLNRTEVELPLNDTLVSILTQGDPIRYDKVRDTYSLGGAKVFLDVVDGKSYVEIEARSERLVNVLKERLGIEGVAITTPYYAMGR